MISNTCNELVKNTASKIYEDKDPAFSGSADGSVEKSLPKIIEGCRNYKEGSQEILYKKFYGYAMAVALTYCTTRADAMEVVNDSFMKVFKNIKTYKVSEPFKPWLRTIIINTSIDKARANKRFRTQMEIDDLQLASSVDVESQLHAKQIYKLLNELPDLLRFVFNMYEIEGYSHREIAAKLDIAESSSRTYLTRAKAQLRQLYKQLFMEDGYE